MLVLDLAELAAAREQVDDRRAPPRAIDAVARQRRRVGARKPARSRRPSDSNTALRVPGTPLDDCAQRRSQLLEPLGIGETMRMPTGVRTPVAIMSMRARAGAVQALPSSRADCADLSSSSISSAVVRGVASGQTRRSTRCSGAGAQLEYQRRRGIFGHSPRGRSRIVVSAIEYGAGSVPVSARPTLPNTVATSSNWLIAWSCQNSCRAACSGGTPGERGRHVEQVALVDARQELAAQPADDGQA